MGRVKGVPGPPGLLVLTWRDSLLSIIAESAALQPRSGSRTEKAPLELHGDASAITGSCANQLLFSGFPLMLMLWVNDARRENVPSNFYFNMI